MCKFHTEFLENVGVEQNKRAKERKKKKEVCLLPDILQCALVSCSHTYSVA